MRVIDAAANRAVEGLRVVEDIVRFAWDDVHLMRRLKQSRHQIAQLIAEFDHATRMRARDTLSDVGTDIHTSHEACRQGIGAILTANFGRAQEALRTLAECAKSLPAADGLADRFEQIRYDIYTLERAATLTSNGRQRLANVRICALVDADESEEHFGDFIGQLVAENVGMIQLREKSLPDNELLARARRLRKISAATKTLFIVNDRADIAAAVQADGVHVGQDDLPVDDARRIVGTGALVGVSTHNIAQARRAVLAGADYLGVGPTFPSKTKSFANFAGLDFVAAVATEIGLPAFAIGGIDETNVAQVAANGLDRVAVQAALKNRRDLPAVLDNLRTALGSHLATEDGIHPTPLS